MSEIIWERGLSWLMYGVYSLMLDAVIFGFYLRSKYWERMKDFPGLTEEDEERVIPLSDWYLLDSVERGEKDASASYTEGDEKPSTSASFTLQESHLRQAVQEAARNTGFGGQFEIWVQRDISKRKIKEPATAIARDDIAIQQYLSPSVSLSLMSWRALIVLRQQTGCEEKEWSFPGIAGISAPRSVARRERGSCR